MRPCQRGNRNALTPNRRVSTALAASPPITPRLPLRNNRRSKFSYLPPPLGREEISRNRERPRLIPTRCVPSVLGPICPLSRPPLPGQLGNREAIVAGNNFGESIPRRMVDGSQGERERRGREKAFVRTHGFSAWRRCKIAPATSFRAALRRRIVMQRFSQAHSYRQQQ